jgi:DNA-binding transcriptional ArsR family regulator
MSSVIIHTTSLQLDPIPLKKSSLVLRTINHKLRRQILQLLHENTRLTVTEIYKSLGLEQSVASQHLGVLRKNGFVIPTREGKCVIYAVNYIRLEEVHKLLKEF